MNQTSPGVTVERLMRAIEEEVRQERRTQIVARGGPAEYRDPAVYAEVEQALRTAIDRRDADLLLPDLLPDDQEWRLQTHLRFSSHRRIFGGLIVSLKRRLLLPLMRWLYEYSLENFRRQEQVNRLLFACIEELAIENAALRRQMGMSDGGVPGPDTDTP